MGQIKRSTTGMLLSRCIQLYLLFGDVIHSFVCISTSISIHFDWFDFLDMYHPTPRQVRGGWQTFIRQPEFTQLMDLFQTATDIYLKQMGLEVGDLLRSLLL